MSYEFEEDEEPTWLVKQREDAKLAEEAFEKNEKVVQKKQAKEAYEKMSFFQKIAHWFND